MPRRLLELDCKSLRFQAGDRILIRLKHPLSRTDRNRLERRIRNWAGQDVEVLVIDQFLYDLEIVPAQTQPSSVFMSD